MVLYIQYQDGRVTTLPLLDIDNWRNEMNELKDLEKTVLSFTVAATVPWLISLILAPFSKFLFFICGAGLCYYTLKKGHYKLGELERAVGSIFGQMVPWWVAPTGHSWFLPAPFGGLVRKTTVGDRNLDHTRQSNKQLERVETADDVQVEVGYLAPYEIVDLMKWVSNEDPIKRLDAILDQTIRGFAEKWSSDEILKCKADMSRYLAGEEVVCGQMVLKTNLEQRLMGEIGVRLTGRVSIDDINLPKSIIDAKESEARETSEARRERRNAEALAEQTKMFSDLGVSPDTAFHGAMVTRKDMTGTYVPGGGDFTKGAVINREGN